MRHRRIAKSSRHKKLKSANNFNDDPIDDFRGNSKNLDDQLVPRKWSQIMDLKNQLKQNSKQRNKKKKSHLIRVTTESEPIEKGMTRSERPLPEVIEQGLYESESHFLSRLSKLSAKAKAEATIEDRFDVDFCQKVSTTEDISGDEKPKKVEKKSNKNEKQKLKRIKRKAKKLNKRGNDDSFGHLSDPIMFGERVDEPPILGHLLKKKKIKK